MRTFALIISVLLSAGVEAGATLVVVIPSRNGLLVAADSRSELGGQICDKTYKIVELRRPARTVVAATGTKEMSLTRDPLPDACASPPPESPAFDAALFAKTYLEADGRQINKQTVDALARRSAENVRHFLAVAPPGILDGRAFIVIVASADALTRQIVASFRIRISAGTPHVDVTEFKIFTPGDPGEILTFGNLTYLNRHVYTRPHTLAKFVALKNALPKPVRDIDSEDAKEAALNLIEEAGKRMAKVPDNDHPIGGPVDVVLLGRSPQRVKWK